MKNYITVDLDCRHSYTNFTIYFDDGYSHSFSNIKCVKNIKNILGKGRNK